MKRIKILGRKKQTPPSEMEGGCAELPKVIETLKNVGEIVATTSKTPMVQELEKVLFSNFRGTPDAPITTNDIQADAPAVPQDATIQTFDMKVKNPSVGTQSTPPLLISPQSCSKESISNSEISELLDDGKDEEPIGFECKQLSGIQLKAKETARFTITLESDHSISGFMYTIISSKNFIHTSHIEIIQDNKISIIINNLSNKDVTFIIGYVAIL